jgi:hypothetical protein
MGRGCDRSTATSVGFELELFRATQRKRVPGLRTAGVEKIAATAGASDQQVDLLEVTGHDSEQGASLPSASQVKERTALQGTKKTAP